MNRGGWSRLGWGRIMIVIFLVVALTSCARSRYRWVSLTPASTPANGPESTAMPTSSDQALRVGVAAILSPQSTIQHYAPLTDYFEGYLGRPIQLIQRQTYAEINEMVRMGQLEMAFVCTGAYLSGEREFGMEPIAVAQVGGEATYHSYIIVPAAHSAQRIEDLESKVFAFTDPLSLSGYFAPLYLLAQRGWTPETFFARTLFTYSHDNSIRSVAEGWVDAAAVDSLVYDAMVRQDELLRESTRVIWTSQPFGTPPVVVSPHIDPQLKGRLREMLLTMHLEEAGRVALARLGVEAFAPAEPSLFDSARQVLTIVGGTFR